MSLYESENTDNTTYNGVRTEIDTLSEHHVHPGYIVYYYSLTCALMCKL